jgi:hypothetical protein
MEVKAFIGTLEEDNALMPLTMVRTTIAVREPLVMITAEASIIPSGGSN